MVGGELAKERPGKKWIGHTYRSVDRLIALEVGVLAETVVRLTEGDAGQAPAHQALVDGVEAAEQVRVPRTRGLGRLGVDNIGGLGQDDVETRLPVLDVLVVDGATSGGLGVLSGSGHCGLLEWLGFCKWLRDEEKT